MQEERIGIRVEKISDSEVNQKSERSLTTKLKAKSNITQESVHVVYVTNVKLESDENNIHETNR